ncbi:MAG: hypothetical protein GY757_55345, partial [bacterium]|nr:hypothetical protein [bacterium]
MEGTQDGKPFPGFGELVENVLKNHMKDIPKTEKKRFDLFLEIIEQWEREKNLSAKLSDYLDGEPGPAHYYLTALSVALSTDRNALLYLTTNYDDLIREAFSDLKKYQGKKVKKEPISLPPNITGNEFLKIAGNIESHIKKKRPVILKLFGDLTSQTPILRKKDMVFEPEVERKLMDWMKKPMLVIGYSFSDKIIEQLLISARGKSPVFVVNPANIPVSIKSLDRVHHIKKSFSGFILEFYIILKEREPGIVESAEQIIDYTSIPEINERDTSDPTEVEPRSEPVEQTNAPGHSPGTERADNGEKPQTTVDDSDRGVNLKHSTKYKNKDFYTNSWALVVGINNYAHENIRNLKYAENDAKAVAACLPALGFPEKNIRLLVSEQEKISREIIFDILETEFNPNMKKDDRLLIFFAGHGISYEFNGLQQGYILMPDSDIFGKWPDRQHPYLEKPPSKALEMRLLLGMVKSLPAKHKLLLSDSCFSGFLAHSRGIYDGIYSNVKKKIAQWISEPVTQVLTAGRSGQKAFEHGFYKHGIFTHYLLKGLQGHADRRGDGVISFQDLTNY